ncbi:META domain-containing protein [Rhodobacteraceae bacterium D3-12]|nr:META domain-containing protein [Rhodobacteraceae bacterium D3-12]
MKTLLFTLILTALHATTSPVSAHGNHPPFDAPGHVWQLIELNGAPFTARATLTFPEPGKLAGQAPCNRYFGKMWGDYPWFKAGQIGATRRACPELAAEQAFLKALGEMSQADASDSHLLLTGAGRQSMVFRLMPPTE